MCDDDHKHLEMVNAHQLSVLGLGVKRFLPHREVYQQDTTNLESSTAYAGLQE